ncbi:MAG: hypothetical protein Q8O87_04130, partial [bacterium]|nr:hypothetical protein [bacterium]
MPERIELSPRHLPEYLEGRTPKKNVLSFLEEIGRAQIRNARNIFICVVIIPKSSDSFPAEF